MKITILNGNMQENPSDFTEYIRNLDQKLSEKHQVSTFDLAGMNLKYCIGCWSCWWKTPGLCTHQDGAEDIFRAVINSDFFIFASPLMAGFTSSELKKITDRMIVLVHPYIQLINGESHHKKRYDKKYPEFGVLLQKESDTDEEDITIVNDCYDRLAINFHSQKRFLKFIEKSTPEEIADAISHI